MQKKRAVVLLRTSTDQGQGIEAQRRECARIAASHGLESVETVVFEGISGAYVTDTPEFKALLERIRQGEFDALICSELSRIMRAEDPANYRVYKALADAGVPIHTSSGTRDYRGDRLLMTLESEMAHLERERIRERTMRGRDLKRARGIRAEGGVGLPFAVAFDHEREEWSYEFPQADQVREVYRLFLGGETNFREIARHCGVGANSNHSQQVRNILSQPLYKGVYRKDRSWKRSPHPTKPGSYRIEMTKLPDDQVQQWRAPGLQPPLIDPADWEQAQVLLAEIARTRPPVKTPEERGCESPYVRRLWCAVCERRMLADRDSRDYFSHVCAGARRHRCPTGSISVRSGDPQLDAQLACLGDPDVLRAIAEESQRPDRTAQTPADATEKRLAELERQASRLRDGYQAGVFELDDLRDRLASLEREAEALRSRRPQERPEEVDADELAAILDVFANWESLRAHERRDLLAAFGARIFVARPRRGVLEVERLELPAIAGSFKKMSRHGIT